MEDELKKARARVREAGHIGNATLYDRNLIVENDLRQNPADDDEALDEQFIRASGIPQKAKDSTAFDQPCHKLWTWPATNDPSILLWFAGEERIPMPLAPKTRGDLRRLCAELKGT